MSLLYTNYLTTPSGKECELREVKNDEFFVLIKFAQAKDYYGFYKSLDSIIKETIPDFDEYNIIDKAYVYLSCSLYSVHNTIVTENTVLGPIELSLVNLLDAIEISYSKLKMTHSINLSPEIKAELTIPSGLVFTHSEISVNYATGLKKIKDIEFNNAQEKSDFFRKITPKLAIQIEHVIKKEFGIVCNLFNDVSVNLILPDIFYLIMQIYYEKLDDYYELIYYHFEYLKWSFDTFRQFTPLETRILFNQFKIDKERQAREHNQSLNNIG